MPQHDTTEVRKIVYGGLGLAFHGDDTVFLPYAAPGDVVEFSVAKRKKNVLFGRIERIVEPSPSRREPACPVFGDCGGCHLLHLADEAELPVKTATVLENLSRIARIRTEAASVTACPSRGGYRNHCVVHVDADGRPGFLRRESSEVVPFPEEGCLLLPQEMRDAIAALPPGALPPGGSVRVRMDRFGAINFWGLGDRVDPPDVLMEADGMLFPVAADAFFQVNRFLNDELIRLVLAQRLAGRRRLLDLYCGVGIFTLPAGRIVGEALGIERSAAAVKGAAAAAKLNKVGNVRFQAGRVEDHAGRLRDFDAVIADPPRSGIPKRALASILRLRPAVFVLVSCDPPTLARDAARLVEAGYVPGGFHVVDLFPGTYHVETVALFTRG